jgi:phosphate-selective porin OprO and OprP
MNPGQKTLGRPLSRLLIASAIAAAFPAYANDASDIEKLKAQIEELDQKLKILGRKQELVNEDVAAKQKAAPTVTASDRGFGFKSQDGQFEYRLRGLVHVDYRHFDGDAYPNAIDGFLARRIRPTFEGTVFGKYGFRFTPEFGENKGTVVDAYLDIREKPEFQIRIGKHKPFVGLERLQSGSDIKFLERSYVSNNILPNRDFGVSIFGDIFDKRLNYAVGVFNGVLDGGDNTTAQDANNKKTFTGRLFATPFINDTDSSLRGLGFGIAGTTGNNSNLITGYKTPGQANNFFAYRSTVSTDGVQERWSPQAHYYKGPLGLMFEYAWVSQPIKVGSNSTTVRNNAWQLAGSWLLTGEDASFRGVKPYNRFQSGPDGGWGAFELVARAQENRIDEKAGNNTYSTTTNGYALSAKTIGLGLNWYLNEDSKFAISYDLTTLGDVTTGTVVQGTKEHFLAARYQLSF